MIRKRFDMLQKTIDAVKRAADYMVTDGFSIERKGSVVNIVTSSDVAVQNYLCKELARIVPGCGFYCEEENVHDPDKEYVWVIDPIDGTANYARGIDACCISVALRHAGETVLGVVYSPARNELYYAERGSGAWMNGKRIHASGRSFKESILCTAMSIYRKEYAQTCSDIIMDTFFQANDVRRFGSAALELCFLARGLCELFFEMRLQPWDYAAGILIAEEAGGVVSSLDGRSPRYDGPDLICGGNNAENHSKFLGIVRKHLDSIPYID